MTGRAVVCERWSIPVPAGPGRGDLAGDRWFGEWVQARPGSNSRHVTASWHAARALIPHVRPGATIREYFGGLGCQSLLLRHLFTPGRHHITERHPDGAAHLSALLAGQPGVTVTRADVYASPPDPAGLAALDFEDFTVHKAAGPRRPWLAAALGATGMGALLTDSGGLKLHLHRARYEADLGGPCGDYPQYLASLDGWLRREFGWRALAAYAQPWTAVLALAPGTDGPPVPVQPVPDRPRGLYLVRHGAVPVG